VRIWWREEMITQVINSSSLDKSQNVLFSVSPSLDFELKLLPHCYQRYTVEMTNEAPSSCANCGQAEELEAKLKTCVAC
jgi:hypothetical protein